MKRCRFSGEWFVGRALILVLLSCAVLAGSADLAHADIIYNNIGGTTGNAINLTSGAYGDQIHFGGTARVVDSFSFQLEQTGNGNTTVTGTLEFFTVSSGMPGSSLNTPIAITSASVPKNQITTITVTVPDVTVPDDVFWVLTFPTYADAGGGVNIQIVNNSPVTVGSSDVATYWYNGALVTGASNGNLAATVSAHVAAAPEPPGIAMTLFVLGLGFGCWFVSARRQVTPAEA